MFKGDIRKFKELEDRAREIQREATELHKKCSYDLCVRRAQESFELYLKFILTLLGRGAKEIWGHELSKLINEEERNIKKVLKEYLNFNDNYTNEIIARIKLGSRTLGLWRELAFYGDMNLKKFKFFKAKEAELALEYVSEASTLSAWMRNHFNSLK